MKIETRVVKTTTTDYSITSDQLENMILDHLDVTGSLEECTVSFDCGDGFLRGVDVRIVKKEKVES